MKIVRLNEEATKSIKRGIDKVADAVKLTLGPAGGNALIGRPYQTPLITNDGITVAREIQLEDEIEQIAKESLDDALQSANSEAGDGTTTTTVLLQAIVNKAFELLEPKNKFDTQKVNPMSVRKQIKEEAERAISLLKPKQIKTLKDLERIATISIENEYIGKNIAKIFHELGKETIIQTVDSPSNETTFDSIKGLTIQSGLPSNHFENTKNRFEAQNPHIIVTNHIIHSPKQIAHFVKDTPVILIADSISKEFIGDCIGSMVVPIKVPVFNESETLKDYAIQLGARFIDREVDDITSFGVEALGTCEQVAILKDKSVFVGVKGDSSKRVEELKDQLKDVESEYDKEQLKKRIQILSGGIGVIRVGADSKSDREYLKLKIEDAVNATRCSLEEGYVKGGGLALKEVAEQMKDSILYEALQAPYNQIQENCGGIEIGEDVIDPVKVTRTALTKASDVAGTIITTKIAIADKREPKKDLSIE